MYHILFEDGDARIGQLVLRSGVVHTPFFMPVITRGAEHCRIGPEDYHRLGAHASDCAAAGTMVGIANSLICAFDPGTHVARSGGLRKWLGTTTPLFTDSGGYQTSAGSSFVVQRRDDGYVFRARWSGEQLHLTPRSSIELQEALGSDVAMTLDDMAPYGSDSSTIASSLERTHAWAKQAIAHRSDSAQLLFGICQGGTDVLLRKQSASLIDGLGFDGNAIGGIGILRNSEERLAAVRAAVGALSPARPRYVMGVGDPADIVRMVGQGIDCFDAAYPTILALRGLKITDDGLERHGTLDAGGEDAVRVAALHNLRYLERLMADVRQAIRLRRYREFSAAFVARWYARQPDPSAYNL